MKYKTISPEFIITPETEEEVYLIKRIISLVDDNGIECTSIETENSQECATIAFCTDIEDNTNREKIYLEDTPKIKENTSCTLSNEELHTACEEMILKLCDTNGKAWKQSIPVDYNKDPDLLLSALIVRFGTMIGHYVKSMKESDNI